MATFCHPQSAKLSSNTRSVRVRRKSSLVLWAAMASLMGLLGPAQDQAWAQASLAAEDQIEDLAVDVKGTQQVFTVVRDAHQRDQWYIIPNRPRIAVRTIQNKSEPEFTLLRYQFQGADGNPVQGGILQFAASLAVPAEALGQLKEALVEKAKQRKLKDVDPAAIKLAGMPMKSARVDLYTPQNGTLVSSSPFGGGLAPLHSSQQMVFSIDLTDKGTEVYDALVRTNTGVPVRVEFTYLGLTPKAGFQVKVNWKKTFEHYSKSEEFRARASWFGLVGASASVSAQSIREKLESDKAIEISVIEGESFDMKQIDTYLQPLVKRINDELLENMKPPQQIEPAKAAVPDASGFFGGAGYSVATKNVNVENRGTEIIQFNRQSIMERKTIAGGFIGIGDYLNDKELMQRLIVSATVGIKSAFFVLPTFNQELPINRVSIQIGLREKGKSAAHNSKVAIWERNGGWSELVEGHRVASSIAIFFPLTTVDAELKDKPLKDLEFLLDTKISSNWQNFETQRTIDAFTGTKDVFDLINLDVVQVDGSVLPWFRVDPTGKVAIVDVNLLGENKSLLGEGHMRPMRINQTFVPPDNLIFLFDRPKTGEPAKPIYPEITFHVAGQPTVPWVYNGKNLRGQDMGLSILLDMTPLTVKSN